MLMSVPSQIRICSLLFYSKYQKKIHWSYSLGSVHVIV